MKARSLAVMSMGACMAAAHCQERNRHWIYENNVRLNIGLDDVTVETGPFFWFQGTGQACISDVNGDLVLYTTMDSVHNAAGSSMAGDEPLIQFAEMYNAMALPLHDEEDRYLLVLGGTTPTGGSAPELAVLGYVLIDPSLNSGSGQVLSDDLLILDDSMSCTIACTPHANGTDYWIMGHALGTDAFHCYKTNGDMPPSAAIVTHTGPMLGIESWTPMDARFSYRGDLFAAVGTAGTGELFVYGFDDATGELEPLFSDSSTFTSVEFSLSGRFLYAIDGGTGLQHIYQYDLWAGDPIAILASKTSVFELQYVIFEEDLFTHLRAGPDGRIYFHELRNSPEPSMLSWIAQPDLPGLACDVQFNALDVAPGSFFGAACANQCRRYHDSGSVVGIPSLPQSQPLSLWPNPASSSIRLHMPPNIVSPRVRIHDSTGRLMRELGGQVALNSTVDVSGLASGIYSVSLLDGSAVVGQARLVVQ